MAVGVRGWYEGQPVTAPDESRPPIRLAEATSTVGQDIAINTVADLTGLSIDFSHDNAEFDVEIELQLPMVYGPVGCLAYAHITDSANTVLSSTAYSVPGATYINQMRVLYVVSTPGVYSFKARGEALLAGPAHYNLDVATVVARLRATEVPRT